MGKDYWYCNLKCQVESHIIFTQNPVYCSFYQHAQSLIFQRHLTTIAVSERSFSLFLIIKASTCMCGQILSIIDFPVCPQEYNCSLFSVTLSRKKTESRNWQIACMRYSNEFDANSDTLWTASIYLSAKDFCIHWARIAEPYKVQGSCLRTVSFQSWRVSLVLMEEEKKGKFY